MSFKGFLLAIFWCFEPKVNHPDGRTDHDLELFKSRLCSTSNTKMAPDFTNFKWKGSKVRSTAHHSQSSSSINCFIHKCRHLDCGVPEAPASPLHRGTQMEKKVQWKILKFDVSKYQKQSFSLLRLICVTGFSRLYFFSDFRALPIPCWPMWKSPKNLAFMNEST